MNAATLRRPALLAGGLALAAVTATAPLAAAGESPAPHNEQVALVHGTNEQPLETKSAINGTAQVTSYDGSAVVFSTPAALVPEDTNGTDDVYLRVRPEGATVLVSQKDGKPGDDASFEPTISNNGQFVAFTTWSTNLAKGTGGENIDVVVHDLASGETTLVSQTTKGKPGKRNSFFPVIAGNGLSVSFQSFAALGPRDQDKKEDVYVRDLVAKTTKQASLLPGADRDVRGGVVNGDVSDNGRYVVWGNSEMLWMRDMKAGETIRFHHEPTTAECQPIEGLASAGRPVISGDGKYVAFSSCSQDLVGDDATSEIFRMRLSTGDIERLTEGNADSYLPSLSRNGRFLSFGSDASNLVEGDDEGQPDGFRIDAETGEVVRVSEGPEGEGGNNWSATHAIAISGDGHTVAYPSYSDNLVAGDVSDYDEVFVWVE